MLTLFLCTVVGLAVLCPDTPLGKRMRSVLIEPLARMSPARMAAGFAVVVVITGVIAYARMEGLMVVGLGVPESLAWFTMFDMATYIDVIGLMALLAASVRLRAVSEVLRSSAVRARHWLRRRVGAFRQGQGARPRPRRSRPKAPRPAKGDDGGWAAPIPALA